MQTDRSNTNNNGRPLKPALATTRTVKSPLTPRLAPSIASASSTQTSRTTRSTTPSTSRANAASHEDRTPVKAFLNSNITPRSSSRKSRVGAGSPTTSPSGTPSHSRPSSTTFEFPAKEQSHGYSGLGVNAPQSAQGGNRPRSLGGANGNNYYNATPSPRPALANVFTSPGASDVSGRGSSPKFFHANQAPVQDGPPPPPPSKKTATFFYANGQQDESARTSELPSPRLSIGRSQHDKFFHADSIPDSRGQSPILTPPVASASLEPWSGENPTEKPPSLRPPSPSKENIHLSYRKGASQIMRPNLANRTSGLSVISQGQETTKNQPQRRSSLTSAVRFGHSKSASLSSIDSVTSPKHVASTDSPSIARSPLQYENRTVSSGSLAESIASAPAFPVESLPGLSSPAPQSPTKAVKSALEHMNELAANARRERKVLDLEISNSSLLAINRGLEREVRKQKTELRRFRRMSRAGRFSVGTSAFDTLASSPPGAYSATEISGISEISDMPEDEEEEEQEPDEEEQESSSESDIDEGTMSPTTLAERDEAHRLRDEKRLQIDLSKHRELLMDSQKMNQSLKKCLNWTEELIKDGQKALAYQVKPSDVGGRVLEIEQDEESKTLLGPWSPSHRNTDPLERTSFPGSEWDSGVDVDGRNSLRYAQHETVSPLGSPMGSPGGSEIGSWTPEDMEETY